MCETAHNVKVKWRHSFVRRSCFYKSGHFCFGVHLLWVKNQTLFISTGSPANCDTLLLALLSKQSLQKSKDLSNAVTTRLSTYLSPVIKCEQQEEEWGPRGESDCAADLSHLIMIQDYYFQMVADGDVFWRAFPELKVSLLLDNATQFHPKYGNA